MEEQHLNRLSNDRLQSRQVDELIGLARGLIADGNINQAEVDFLQTWLVNNLATSHQPLIATLYDRVRDILADGVADSDECADLLAALARFTAGGLSWAKPQKRQRYRFVIRLLAYICGKAVLLHWHIQFRPAQPLRTSRGGPRW